MADSTFTATGGQDPVQFVLRLGRSQKPTVGDVTMVAYRALSIIIQRTQAGRDVNGQPFAPYSTSGPIYIYPNAAGRKDLGRKKRRSASLRFARRIGAGPGVAATGRGATRIGLKFASYAAYKDSLGRTNVDLMGAKGKMLQAVKAQVPGGGTIEQGKPPSAVSDRVATQFTIGLWDQALAKIGSAHNTGAMTGRNHRVRLPQRYWFGLSGPELQELGGLLNQLIMSRVEAASNGV